MYPSSKQIKKALACVFTSLKIDDLELKREYKAALKAVAASNTIASLSNILPTGFRRAFCGGPSRKSQGSIAIFLLFLFIFAFKQSNQDTTCITSIDDTVKFVHGHTEAFMEIALTIALTRGFKYNGRYKTQVTRHCFTNTESIPNIHKS